MARQRPITFQDLREDSPTYGAVAVALPNENSLGDYAVMTLDRGGSYPRAERIEGWTPLVPEPPTLPDDEEA